MQRKSVELCQWIAPDRSMTILDQIMQAKRFGIGTLRFSESVVKVDEFIPACLELGMKCITEANGPRELSERVVAGVSGFAVWPFMDGLVSSYSVTDYASTQKPIWIMASREWLDRIENTISKLRPIGSCEDLTIMYVCESEVEKANWGFILDLIENFTMKYNVKVGISSPLPWWADLPTLAYHISVIEKTTIPARSEFSASVRACEAALG